MIKLKLTVVALFMMLAAISSARKYKDSPPNVILIMTDDQGYGDIAANGNPIIKTPHLDKLYGESVRFTDFHVNAFCAPSRAALMTGRMSDRTQVTSTIHLRNHLNLEETTMAEFFKASGYQTALFGKWHLGSNYPYRPMDRGFNQWVGHGDGGTGTSSDYWGNDRMNDTYYRNGVWEKFEGFSTDIYFNETYRFIEQNKAQPFFIYLATNEPHSPWNVPADWRKPYDAPELGLTEDEKDFFATISHLDHKIGELRNFLRVNDLEDNTILVFLTDNGTAGGERVFNAGMKGKKGSRYEGGHRVPLFFYWPQMGLNIGREVSEFTAHIDILPTFIDLCHLKTPERGHLPFDGRSLSSLLLGKASHWGDRTLFIHSQNVREVPVKGLNSLVATQRWRLVDGIELYDIHSDPGEEHNVFNQYPSVVADLNQRYNAYWKQTGAGYFPYPRPVVGSPKDVEVWLTPDGMIHDHARVRSAMQSFVLEASRNSGFWPIKVAEKGTYVFDVRRWPRETNCPISVAIPAQTKSDICHRGKAVLMKQGKEMDVSKVRLRVGDLEKELSITDRDLGALFKIDLEEGPTLVRAWLIDDNDRESGAYYVYIRKED